jgi:hypothetical protein
MQRAAPTTDASLAGGRLAALAATRHVPLIIDNAYGAPCPDILFVPARPFWAEHVILTMSLSKLGLPGTGRATAGRDWRRFERFAEVREYLPDPPRLGCNAMSRMSPPHPGHASGNSSPTRAMSSAHAIREVSWERGLSLESQAPVASPPAACPPTACPPVAASHNLPLVPMASAVTAGLSL